MQRTSTPQFGVASMYSPSTPIRIIPIPERPEAEEISTSSSNNKAADLEIGTRKYRNTNTTSSDEDNEEDEELTRDVPHEASDEVKQNGNGELRRAQTLDEKNGWSVGTLLTMNKHLDFDKPFGRHQYKKYDLQRIPAEIRMDIYELVLVSEKPIRATQHPRDAIPPLLQVCRQVRLEALPIFYSRNAFLHIIPDANTAHLCHWLTSIGPECCRLITKLAVCCEGILRSFDNTDDNYTGVSQAWMALVKTLHRNQVRREAICTFSDSYNQDEFEDDEEVQQAQSYTDHFHRVVMGDYLERAGYRTGSSTGSASPYEPRGRFPNLYRAAPELDLIEVDERRKRDMDASMTSVGTHNAARRLQTYLASGGMQHISIDDHISKTPAFRFYRAADASDEPELSSGYKKFVSSLVKTQTRAPDASQSEKIKAALERSSPSPDKTTHHDGPQMSPKPSRSGPKRKRAADDGEACEDAAATQTAHDTKRLKFGADLDDERKNVLGNGVAIKNKRRVIVKASRFRVTGMKMRSRRKQVPSSKNP